MERLTTKAHAMKDKSHEKAMAQLFRDDPQLAADYPKGLRLAPQLRGREDAWHQSCEDALKHVDETGLHATHAQVMAWLATWGTDKELPTPLCHP
jgi:hypothetical protein